MNRNPYCCRQVFFFYFLFSLLFNEPTLEDLERRSCSFAVTYLPASAPYSTEGINLGSRRGAHPAARCRRRNSRRAGGSGRGSCGGRCRLGSVMDGLPGGKQGKSAIAMGDKLLNCLPFNLGWGKPNQTC